MTESSSFPDWAFRRLDEETDLEFYSFPRRVVHIDDGAIATLGAWYGDLLPYEGRVLDLMSSWRSHFPPTFRGTIVGLGLNAEEMADNPQLASSIVHDVNLMPTLPFSDDDFDAAVCAVSVQYLVRPVDVFSEVRRTLRPGAPFVVSFSNRCFPQKAVALWRTTEDEEHVDLVTAYFAASGGWSRAMVRRHIPADGDPLYAVHATRT